MKNKLVSTLLATLVAASCAASAATATQASPFAVTLPNLTPGITMNLTGLLLQPTDSNLVYVNSAISGSNSQTFSSSSVDPNYDFGFGVGLGYIFPESGNDVQVNWQHFDQSSDDSTGPVDAIFIGDDTNAYSNVNFKFDTVDLDVGQYLDIGTRFRTRLFAGLRYANLREDASNSYSSVSTPNNIQYVNQNSKFEGIGPRLGVETNYHVSRNFGVVTQLGASMLVGRISDDANTATNFDVGTTTNSPEDITRVVPSLDAKLGFDYTIPFKNQMSSMTIEAGYQVEQFFDAIDKTNVNAQPPVGSLLGAPAAPVTGTTTSSIGFNGPYLTLNFKF